MKRIKFTELGFKKNLDTLVVCVGLIFLVIGLIAVFGFLNQKLSGLAGLSTTLVLYPQFKNFFYKNYIFWNKRGGSMKLNSKSYSFQFDTIKEVEINNDKLFLDLKNGSIKEFSTKDINPDDLNYLLLILKK
ncbi:hypothetical protein [Flavobacterium okayamense]|uniref:PH domain-containing protein n=1 Tax=Flavobacterium okayamense TaxID=2830782 RepID=A0ABM7S435_9FLAO|nr:hypothetical protein [Flavobacterium okayamense]BCY28222.1 hypothetical protein KK2020170_10900 [Flavobacterium okayamense]